MKRKLVQAGGSLAVTLPSEVVRGLKLRKGQEVDVTVHPTSGAVIVRAGGPPEKFYMITRGRAEVVLEQTNGDEIIVATLERGQYFGEIELMRGGGRLATIRATDDASVELSTLDRPAFTALVSQSQDIQEELGRVAEARLAENIAGRRGAIGD